MSCELQVCHLIQLVLRKNTNYRRHLRYVLWEKVDYICILRELSIASDWKCRNNRSMQFLRKNRKYSWPRATLRVAICWAKNIRGGCCRQHYCSSANENRKFFMKIKRCIQQRKKRLTQKIAIIILEWWKQRWRMLETQVARTPRPSVDSICMYIWKSWHVLNSETK